MISLDNKSETPANYDLRYYQMATYLIENGYTQEDFQSVVDKLRAKYTKVNEK